MTPARFDAPASNTPASRYARALRALSAAVAERILREMWLVAHDACGKPTLAHYCRRFGVSPRSFRRDLRRMRRAGLELESMFYGDYRTLFWLMDTEED